MAKKKTSWTVWLRRLIQTAFLLLFFYLFLQTAYHPINKTGRWVTLFFELDPLVLLTVLLAARTFVVALLLSLVTLGLTLLFGRWFCGWVCPLGALHNFFTSLRGGRLKENMEAGGYSRWQKAKYYLLVFFLGSALVGFNLAGWLDPFSFLYRSMAVSVYPAIQSGIQGLFGWIYQTNPGMGRLRLTDVSEPVYEVLRRYFLAVEQPHYYWGLLIGVLFFAAVGLNFYRARFWCRYLCPLGALLGVVGKNPVLRLVKNNDQCNDCRLCLPNCQGAADPQSHGGWKPSECFFCWNCESKCPTDAISFRFEVPEEKKS
jgi:polyferredoxin